MDSKNQIQRRKIKFRRFNKRCNEMVTVLGIDDLGHFFQVVSDNPDTYEIMQFTGLKDKNGKNIYEGDILKNTKHGFLFKVQWGIEDESYAGWAGNWLDRDFISPLFNGPLENCKIVGNIYENPELLKPTS